MVDSAAQFDRFYQAYPRHKHRGDALKAWRSINPDESLAQAIVDAAMRHREWHHRNGTEQKYIPYPATWLRAMAWEDELEEPQQQHDSRAYCVYCSAYGHYPQSHRA